MEPSLDATLNQHEIVKIYNKLSRTYNAWGHLAESRARRRAISLAGIKDGETILEVAVGTGLGFYEIVKRNPNGTNTGIDISTGMLQKAEERMRSLGRGNFSLRLGNASTLEVPDHTIDLLVNNYMFDLIPFDQMGAIINEFRRVLKPDGRLILVNMTLPETCCADIYDRIYMASPRLMGGCRGIVMSRKLQAHGFVVEKREYISQMCFPSEVIRATVGNLH